MGMKTTKITIGRDPYNNLVLSDPRISSYHAEIKFTPEGEIILVDRSTNGTWVNGRLVPKGKDFYLEKTDQVNFAGVAPLDWQSVISSKEAVGRTRFSIILQTKFFSDLRRVVREASEFSEIAPTIRLFWAILQPGSSTQILAWANDLKSERVNPLRFFLISVGFFIFCAVSISIPEAVAKAEGGLIEMLQRFSSASNPLEVLIYILLVPIIYIGAYFSYQMFKLFVGAGQHWAHFNRMYMLCVGFGFLGFGFFLTLSLPAIFLEMNGEFILLMVKFSLGLSFLHALHVYLLIFQTHTKFWKIPFITTVLIVLAKTFVLLMLLMLAIKFFRS